MPFRDQEPYTQPCNHTFRHCCLGQCRQLRFQHPNASQLFQKWSLPLATLEDVLVYRHYHNQPCTLYFIGDSLSTDHSMSAVCQLMEAGYELGETCNPDFGRGPWGESNIRCNSNGTFHLDWPPYVELLHPKRNICPRVVVAGSVVAASKAGVEDDPRMKHSSALIKEGGIMVWNIGVHCDDPACLGNKLERHFLSAYEKREDLYSNWDIMWRETEPQHFDSEGGGYRNRRSQQCRSGKVDNWRNKFVEGWLQKHATNVPIVRIFDALEPLWEFHYGSGDCTHYCYSPWRFHLTWDGMLRGPL